ncbi:DUF3237 domain-containing protein [Variovorax sp. UC122_21]|uniref:DUF3237 domain-containing protein n=1 Tax=Variovorax sp. UC122_21 TaxID=3374554 RepID=UPI003757F25E
MTLTSLLRSVAWLFGGVLAAPIVPAAPAGGALPPLRTEFLATLIAPLHAPQAPSANLLVFSPSRAGGTLRGRINAEVIDPTGDWVRVMPNGSMRIDVRMMARLDDGELLYVTYGGVLRKPDEASWSRFMAGERIDAPRWYYVVTPQFETASKKYAWLNDVQALGRFLSIQTGEQAHVAFELLELE